MQIAASSPLPGSDTRQTTLLSLTVPLLSVRYREKYIHTHIQAYPQGYRCGGAGDWLREEGARSDGTTSHGDATPGWPPFLAR